MKSGFEDTLKAYTPTEVWLIDLAIAVIAVLGGLPGRTWALAAEDLRSLDQGVHSHLCKKGLKQARESWNVSAGPRQHAVSRA